MSNPNNRQRLPALDQEPGEPRPIEQLHPVLLDIVERMGVMPPKNRASITQVELAAAVLLAISLLPGDEQAYIVSRIMTDDEIAEEKLQRPQVQDLEHPIHLSGNEIRLLLRGSPEPKYEGDEENENCCVACFAKSDVSAPCGCHYCGYCHRQNIRHGLRSELDFPPVCCGGPPFDEATIRLAKRPGLVHLFRQLSAEYDVEPGKRLYCHDPSCSSFIPPGVIQPAARDEDNATPVGICLSCHKATCAACGSRSHRGLPCREEGDDEALLDMMDNQELVSCPECGVVIALRDGCNHMRRGSSPFFFFFLFFFFFFFLCSQNLWANHQFPCHRCPCGAEFCYICGREWTDGCRCPEYNGFHLRVPVRQRPGRPPILRGGRAHLVSDTDEIPQIPQLRYDPEDEVALAAVDYAPIGASAPTAVPSPVPSPGPNRVQETVVRRNEAEHMEIPLHMDVLRPPRHRQHAPAVRRNVFNGGPIGLRPMAALPPFLDEPPLPIPVALTDAFSNPFLHPFPHPFSLLALPPLIDHPSPDYPHDHWFNNRLPEPHPLADGDFDVLEHATERLDIISDIISDTRRDRSEADRYQSVMTIRDFERQRRQTRGPNFVLHEATHLIQGHEESQGGEDSRRHRLWGRFRVTSG